ncbi:hypothetical protein GCM10027060_14100 [Nesterenkonia halophila]
MASPGPRRSPSRPSPAVYRRRRLVVALLAVVLVALLWWIGSSLAGMITSDEPEESSAGAGSSASESSEAAPSSSSAEESPSGSASGSPSGGSSDSPADDGTCAASDVEVRASTDQDEYGLQDAPVLQMEVENTGEQPCTLDLGTAEQEYSITHAGEEVFTTAQCEFEETSLPTELVPDEPESARLTWPRADSSVDCAEPAESLPGGVYELRISVSGISSDPQEFTLAGAE